MKLPFALVLANLLAACVHHAPELEPESAYLPTAMPLRLGQQDITLEQRCNGTTPVLYFRPHSNETTAGNALRTLAAQGVGGCFVLINNHLQRHLTFTTQTGEHSIDPNRIFSEAGRVASLARHGQVDEQTVQQSREFAQALLRRYIQPARFIITAHNNTHGGTDIHSYQHPPLSSNAAQVFINPAHDPDDYALVTSTAAFDYFKARGWNVVQQNNVHVADDGSLSVYAAQHNIGYINIEAEYGHAQAQREMLQTAQDFLKMEQL